MSANNQILIKKHNSKWYVFDDVMAEGWSAKNEISKKSAVGIYDTEQEAINKASEIMYGLEWPEEREYGIQFNLYKDGADVKIID
jgi:hypothetical protein